jgi:hypothetical protein
MHHRNIDYFEQLFNTQGPLIEVIFWRRYFREMITDKQSRNFSPFTQPEGSLPYSQKPAAGSSSDPDESGPQLKTLFKIQFNIVLPLRLGLHNSLFS